MRRLAVVACAFALLPALPASAGAKVIDVPGEIVYRAHSTSTTCSGNVFVQWPEQENASAWRLEREYLKGTANILTHNETTLFSPFHDQAFVVSLGAAPPPGHHWHRHTFLSKSAPGGVTDCTGTFESELVSRLISATLHITVPDDPEEEESEEDEKSEEDDSDGDDPAESSKDKEKDPPEEKVAAPKCRGNTPTIFARPGTPTNGTARRDVILGTPGRDVIRGRGGNDLICALPGNDTVLGGGGRDVLLGQGGADTIVGQGGRDALFGGGGDDRLFGQAAADRLFGQAGADVLNGGGGRPDLCHGGPGRDQQRSPGCERRLQIP